jgi:hypothetical protein
MDEYQAGTATWNSLANFRFTLVGLYLAAVGLLYTGSRPEAGAAILCLAIPVWLIDFRTRLLLRRTQDRLKEIEHEQSPTGQKPDEKQPTTLFYALDYAPRTFRFLGFNVPHWRWRERIISYSTAIDLLMVATVAIAIVKLTVS